MALCVCLHTEAKQRSGRREDWKDVVLLKSTVSICLSVRCLAWLSSTERWWRQNDGGVGGCGCRVAHATECQFGCKAPFPQKLPHTMKTKTDRGEVYGQSKSHIYIKPTRSHHTHTHMQWYCKHCVTASHASCHNMTSESPSKMFVCKTRW